MWKRKKQNKTKTETIKLDITLLEEKRLCTQSFLFFLWETKLFPNIQSCLCKDVCSRAEWTNLWVLSVFFLYLRWHETNRARWFSFFFLCVFFCFVFKTDGQKQSFTINCCTSVLQAVEEASYSLWTSLDAVALEEQL